MPTDLVPFPAPPPTRVRVEPDFKETVAFWPDGRVAWRLLVAQPLMEPQIPIEADETILCATASGHLVALEYPER